MDYLQILRHWDEQILSTLSNYRTGTGTATGTSSTGIDLGPVHTITFSKVFVFLVIEIASNGSRPHYHFDAFSTVPTKKFENGEIARCDVSWTVCYRQLDRFLPSTLMRLCVFVLIHFQERFQIDAFSIKTLSVLVWTKRLNASKCMRFQTKSLQHGRGEKQLHWPSLTFIHPHLPPLAFFVPSPTLIYRH